MGMLESLRVLGVLCKHSLDQTAPSLLPSLSQHFSRQDLALEAARARLRSQNNPSASEAAKRSGVRQGFGGMEIPGGLSHLSYLELLPFPAGILLPMPGIFSSPCFPIHILLFVGFWARPQPGENLLSFLALFTSLEVFPNQILVLSGWEHPPAPCLSIPIFPGCCAGWEVRDENFTPSSQKVNLLFNCIILKEIIY